MKLSDFIIRFPSFTDARGTLTVADMLSQPQMPFTAQRIFWISDIPSDAIRGGHAHRTCHELVVCCNGSCQITLTVPKTLVDSQTASSNTSVVTQTFTLKTPNEALWIPANVWCQLHDFTEHATLLCLASEPYSPSGYINDYEDFMCYMQQNNL